ncbi:MAG TPA: VWA domain-containing protein [Methanotrichaceae archaeon]|nr:VWA domain-containing protein [Methanotrichaceae archaeon]
MKTIWLLLIFGALGLSWPFTAWGSSISSYDQANNPAYKEALTWYSPDEPVDAYSLSDEGARAGHGGKNDLWIVDFGDKERRTSLDIPPGNWARLRLEPAASGDINVYCQYPTGSTDLLIADKVSNGHSYNFWYHSEAIGDYKVWYTVGDGLESKPVEFNVSEQYEYSLTRMPSTTASGSMAPSPMMARSNYAAAPAQSPGIGFSTGGAKDIGNFRENIKNGYLPLPTDITYEGLFYDYFFDTGKAAECNKLFCPSYSYAVSMDPFSKEPQYYLTVGLNSGITDFQRKKLNLVVVLDNSGSMGESFNRYYYDNFGNQVNVSESEGSEKKKMDIADQAVADLLSHLKDDDRFGLVIFSDNALIVDPLTRVGDKDLSRLKEHIQGIAEDGSTNMQAGMNRGTRLFSRYLDADPSEYENRMIFLTDAMPNVGQTDEDDLSKVLLDNSGKKIYTTFIGIGVDFNTELAESITKVRGANYYSVHSSGEFKERMDDEFDYMVTPLVFDLKLSLDAPGYEIEKVYGSPEADEATGELMKVNTLFPSKAEEGQVKGGVVLVKLKKASSKSDMGQSSMKLKVSYQDRNGVPDSDEAELDMLGKEPDFYQNTGIRKAVLLTRYADLLKDWAIDERAAHDKGRKIVPTVTLERGIVVPVILGEWERQSMPLVVSEPYQKLFGMFGSYFEDERKAIGDDSLQQEQVLLEKLSRFQG